MKVTILGCGSAGGVPLIGNAWGQCDPADPRNRRTRPSALVEEGDVTLLVDTSPDMREQLLRCDLRRLTAVLYTHAHADHCHGIDDLRSVNWLVGQKIPVYCDDLTLKEIRDRFGYIFKPHEKPNVYTRPALDPHLIEGPFCLGLLNITPILQGHGDTHSIGYRFNDFAYTTDVNILDDEALDKLKNLKVWVVGCVREKPHPSHANLAKILEWVELLKPAQTFLTHMDHSMDYATLVTKLPKNVAPAYDCLTFEC